MLFKRLYNWVKYKTLPPSFLFKNRLFVERDSKHRRIFSNFGLNFRGSKWSEHRSYNIKSKFKSSYFKLFLFVLISFLGLFASFYFSTSYVYLYASNTASALFWFAADSIDYFLGFCCAAVAAFVTALFNGIYSYFFFNNFSAKKFLNGTSADTFSSCRVLPNLSKNFFLSLSKHDLNWTLYSWVSNREVTETASVNNLFHAHFSNKWWGSQYNFFPKLYRTAYFFNLINKNTAAFDLKQPFSRTASMRFFNQSLSASSYFGSALSLKNSTNFLLWNAVNSPSTSLLLKDEVDSVSVLSLQKQHEWSLRAHDKFLFKYSFLTDKKLGVFFLDNFNYEKFNALLSSFYELWGLNFYVKNQIKAAKWNRWLYRYSILHRKILKSSHKLTTAKRLLNSGFYDNNFFNRNVWTSEYFSKDSTPLSLFSGLFSSYYKNLYHFDAARSPSSLLSTKLTTTGNDQITLLSSLSFYENSYFWFLKRFYLFNTLPHNAVKSKSKTSALNLNYASDANFFKNKSVNDYRASLAYLLNSELNALPQVTFAPFTGSAKTSSAAFTADGDFIVMKDIYLLLRDAELFTKDDLTLLNWLSSSASINNSLVVRAFLTENSLGALKGAYFYKPISFDFINLYIYYSLIPLDATYTVDLENFTLFY